MTGALLGEDRNQIRNGQTIRSHITQTKSVSGWVCNAHFFYAAIWKVKQEALQAGAQRGAHSGLGRSSVVES